MLLALGYILLFLDNFLREVLRTIYHANRFQFGIEDKKSSFLTMSYLFLVPAFPLLANLRVSVFENTMFQWVGIVLQIIGIGIRILAMHTLGSLYTGTLQITDNHRLVTKGIYGIIRHPGYFAALLVSVGFGLSVGNWIVLAMIILTFSLVYSYRISTEENMLTKHFGSEYIHYTMKSKKIIPYVY